MKRYQQIQQKWRKKILAFCMILSVIGSFLSYMGAYAILFEIKLIPKLFDIKIILISLLMAILTPLGIMSPILTTLIMAFQASVWIRNAVFDLKISPIRGFTFEWIIEVNSLLKALNVISKWLGVQLLLTVLLKATLFVVTVYMAVDSTSMTQSYVKVFLIGAFIVWALEALTILIMLNLASEGVIEDVQDLKKIMEMMEATDKIEVEFEGKFLAQTYIRSLMVNELESFKGFDLHGFSKLGKPLLCSIFGMSLTYLIVLMQFRISEQ